MTTVVLISGKAEHGKTLACFYMKKLLEDNGRRVLKVAFADYLKFIAEKYYGWNGEKDKDGRELLQQLGTNLIRERCHNFWADSLFNLVSVLHPDFDYVVVDDCRFPNEISVFEESYLRTISVRVERLNYENSITDEQRLHPSETALDYHKFDYNLYAGDSFQLQAQVAWLVGEI